VERVERDVLPVLDGIDPTLLDIGAEPGTDTVTARDRLAGVLAAGLEHAGREPLLVTGLRRLDHRRPGDPATRAEIDAGRARDGSSTGPFEAGRPRAAGGHREGVR
jgi:hypothetical protein